MGWHPALGPHQCQTMPMEIKPMAFTNQANNAQTQDSNLLQSLNHSTTLSARCLHYGTLGNNGHMMSQLEQLNACFMYLHVTMKNNFFLMCYHLRTTFGMKKRLTQIVWGLGYLGSACFQWVIKGPEVVLKIKGLQSHSVVVTAVGGAMVGACVVGSVKYG